MNVWQTELYMRQGCSDHKAQAWEAAAWDRVIPYSRKGVWTLFVSRCPFTWRTFWATLPWTRRQISLVAILSCARDAIVHVRLLVVAGEQEPQQERSKVGEGGDFLNLEQHCYHLPSSCCVVEQHPLASLTAAAVASWHFPLHVSHVSPQVGLKSSLLQ